MKYFVALLLAVLFVLPMSGTAEEAFSLRNGYTWGMPKEKALALAQEEGLGPNISQADSLLGFTDVSVGSFTASFFTMRFENEKSRNQLNYISYSFDGLPAEGELFLAIGTDLLDSLVSVYGECSSLIPGAYYGWVLPDTEVTLMRGPDFNGENLAKWSIVYAPVDRVKNGGF